MEGGADRGAVLVWMAALISLMLATGALVVDLGYGYVVKGQLADSADAAALAGAQAAGRAFKSDPSLQGCGPQLDTIIREAVDETHAANSPADSNGVLGVGTECLDAAGNSAQGLDATSVVVTVTERRSLPTLFGRILGVRSLEPSASAIARVYGGVEQTGLRPFTVCLTNELNTGPVGGRIYVTLFGDHDPGAQGACQPTSTAGTWGYAGFGLPNDEMECLVRRGYGPDCGGRPAGVAVGDNGSPGSPRWPGRSTTTGTGHAGTSPSLDPSALEELLDTSILLPVADFWTGEPLTEQPTLDDPDGLGPTGLPIGSYDAYGTLPVVIRGYAFPSDVDPTDIISAGTYNFSSPCESTCHQDYPAAAAGWTSVQLAIFWEYDPTWVASYAGQDTSAQCVLGSTTCAPVLQLIG